MLGALALSTRTRSEPVVDGTLFSFTVHLTRREVFSSTFLTINSKQQQQQQL